MHVSSYLQGNLVFHMIMNSFLLHPKEQNSVNIFRAKVVQVCFMSSTIGRPEENLIINWKDLLR